MKRMGMVLLALALLLHSFPAMAEGESAAFPCAATVTTVSGPLNLRANPTKKAKAVARVKNGQQVTVLQEKDGWYHISYKEHQGWAMDDYITLAPGEENAGTSSQEVFEPQVLSLTSDALIDAGEGGGAPGMVGGSIIEAYVESASLKVYQWPDAAGKVVYRAEAGQEASVLEKGATWSFVKINDAYGFVKTAGLSFPQEETAEGAEHEATYYTIPVKAGDVLTLYAAPEAAGEAIPLAVVEITTPGEAVVLKKSQGAGGASFRYVKYGDMAGWVKSEDLAISSEEEALIEALPVSGSSASVAYVKTGGATLYEGKSTQKSLAVLSSGAAVTVHARENGFAEVTVEGRQGYMRVEDLSSTPPETGVKPETSPANLPESTKAPAAPPSEEKGELITRQSAMAKGFSALQDKYLLESGWEAGLTVKVTLNEPAESGKAPSSDLPNYRIDFYDDEGDHQGMVVIHGYTGEVGAISWQASGSKE